jgi:hypothetical protein
MFLHMKEDCLKDDVIKTQMSSKHDQVTLMTFVRSTQEQRGVVNIETRAKKLVIRKSTTTCSVNTVKNTRQSTSSGLMKETKRQRRVSTETATGITATQALRRRAWR